MHLGQSEWLPSAACSTSEDSEETIVMDILRSVLVLSIVLCLGKRKEQKGPCRGCLGVPSNFFSLHSKSGLAVEKCCYAQILSQKIGWVLWQHVHVEAMAVSAVNQTVARRTLLVPWFHRSFDIFDRHFQHFLILVSVASSLLSFSFVGRSLVLGSSGISASATASRKGLIVKAFWILNEGVFCCCTKKYIVLFATTWALSYSKSRKHPYMKLKTQVHKGITRASQGALVQA